MLAAIASRTRRAVRRLTGDTFSEGELVWQYFADQSSGTMLDVGAHYGESHRAYLKRGWDVLAFEPDPSNRARIRQSGDGRLTLMDCAISNHEAEAVSYFASDESTGISSLAPFVPSHKPVCTVAVRTLAALYAEGRFKGCDFLKIDTEGHDLFVLQGFPWEQLRPSAVLCEFEDRKTIPLGYDYHELGRFLLDLGYKVYLSEWAPITRYGVDHTWRRLVSYPAALIDERGWGNFVAFHGDVPLPPRAKTWLSRRLALGRDEPAATSRASRFS